MTLPAPPTLLPSVLPQLLKLLPKPRSRRKPPLPRTPCLLRRSLHLSLRAPQLPMPRLLRKLIMRSQFPRLSKPTGNRTTSSKAASNRITASKPTASRRSLAMRASRSNPFHQRLLRSQAL